MRRADDLAALIETQAEAVDLDGSATPTRCG
jgi:hypothetical protein